MLKNLPILAKFESAVGLPSGSNRAKKSQSNGNRPFFALEAPLFFLIQFFLVAKPLNSDRAQHFASDNILFAKILRFLSA